MSALGGDPVIISSSFLGLCLLLTLVKIFHKLWWIPFRVKRLMASQGIKGPSYRFFYGSTKEILSMRKEAMATPMGLSHAIFPRVHPHVDSWIKIYGRNYLQWYGAQAQLVVTETELIKEVLSNRDGTFPKPDNPAYVKKLLGDGLVATNRVEKWAKLRKLANYAFHGHSLKGMIPAMISSVEMMLERWKVHEGKEVEVFEEFRLFTSEVIARTAFGSSYLKGKEIFDMLNRLALLASKNGYKLRVPGISKVFRSGDEIESDKLEKEIRNYIIEIIREREMVMSGEEDSFGSDFLGLLVTAHHESNDNLKISVDDLADECKTFYFAGQETTNTLLAWTTLLLAMHTDWQEEARKEVLSLFGHQNPNLDNIAKLKIMGMVFNETLRLYPPVAGLVRKPEREVRLGKLILPANNLSLYLPTLALHHDPQIWGEDVDEFKPERFSDGVAEATKNNPAAYLPFGMGPRNCVGSNFAITEAKIALSMILQRYSFTLSPAYVHSPFQVITIRPHHGIQVILQPL